MTESKNQQTTESTFLKGAMILGVSMVVVKVIGMIYKILLAYVFDGVGYGIFNIAYELYNPLFMLATAGFPIAISRMVSESVARGRYRDARRIHKISIPIFVLAGITCFTLMILLANIYVQIVGATEARLAIYALAPTIFFGCLVSIYRGYYEGMRNMMPTAISEIIEASSKLLLGLALAYFVNYIGTQEYLTNGTLFGNIPADKNAFATEIMSYTVAAAIIGIALGSFLAFLFLFLRHRIKGDSITREQLKYAPPSRSAASLRKQLIKTAIPIGLGAIIMSSSGTIDSIFVQRRIIDIMNSDPYTLQSIYSFVNPEYFVMNQNGEYQIQTFLYGAYGYASTLMMIVTAVTQVFGTSALPTITAAWTSKQPRRIKSSIETVLRTTTLFTLPAGIGMCLLAEPIINLIYGSPARAAEVQVASSILQIMGISVIFIATSTPICSMLQAVGRVDLPLKLLTVGMIIKIILNYTLVGIPQINIQGATVGSFVGYMFITVSGLYLLCKETKIVPNFVSIFIKPLIGAIICAVAALCSYNLLQMAINAKIATIVSILIAAIVYITVLLLIRGITKSDILMLPKGNKIAKVLEKHKLIR
ncbi:MAG: polysaccharide biosynthesis C-terminal domain-containing protein [Acutalibacteraceae bacterium]